MDSEQNDMPLGGSPYHHHESADPTMPKLWSPASSPTDFNMVTDSDEPVPEPQNWPGLIDSFASPIHSSEGNLPQEQRAEIPSRDRDMLSHPGVQPHKASGTNVPVYARRRGQPDREYTPRPERKNTKRRRTGPDRFDNYPHGDTPLPRNATTKDVFQKYPNHITDEDIEEYWRLGLSARQISDLMPVDTHFNSEGVHVQQHHSLIQKKFKRFKLRHEMRQQAMKDQAARVEGQRPLNLGTAGLSAVPDALRTNPGAGGNVPPSTTDAMAGLPDLKFRYYPFGPTNNQALEARMSIELAKIESLTGHAPQEDHEIRILNLLIWREIQKHGSLLKRWFMESQTSTGGVELHPKSETDVYPQPQRLHSFVDCQRALHYRETSRFLSAQARILGIDTTRIVAASEALRQLHSIIDRIFVQRSFNATLPSARRPIFNFEHGNLRKWRVLVRFLYYLASITRTLEDGLNASTLNVQSIPGVKSNLDREHVEEVRARQGSQTKAASDEQTDQLVGLLPRRHLPSIALFRKSAMTVDQRAPYAILDPAPVTTPINTPTATRFATAYSTTASRIKCTSAGASAGAFVGNLGRRPVPEHVEPPFRPLIAVSTIQNPSDQRGHPSASAVAAREQTISRTSKEQLPVSPRPPQTPSHPVLPMPAIDLFTGPTANPAHLSLAPEPGSSMAPHRASSPQFAAHHVLPPTQPLQTSASLAHPLRPGTLTSAYNLPTETQDYMIFPEDDEANDDCFNQMIDFDAWDATSIARAESPETPN